jgi:hypothetical protein
LIKSGNVFSDFDFELLGAFEAGAEGGEELRDLLEVLEVDHFDG